MNALLNVIGFALGVGSLSTALATLGKEAFKKLLTKEIIPLLLKQLEEKAGIIIAASIFTTSVIDQIIENILDPGSWIANWIDSEDKIPDNGWIELW